MLCLQLNRLEYKATEATKHRHRVEIEKTVLLDRFMLENKEKIKQIRAQVKTMRD